MSITKPDHGDTNWDTATNQVIDYINDDIALPATVSATGAGQNTFTAGSGTANTWFDLTTFTCIANFTNPHATKDLLCMISVGAWLITATSGVDVRFGIRISGDLTVASGPGLSDLSPPGWGLVPLNANPSASVSFGCSYAGIVPANSTLTFTGQSFFSSTTGNKSCNYPTFQIMPIRYLT